MSRGFHSQEPNKVLFCFNPNDLLSTPAKAEFYKNTFTGIPIDVPYIAQFCVRMPRFSSEPPYPYIKPFRPLVGSVLPVEEPLVNVLPQAFGIVESCDFNFLAGIGVPEKSDMPTLDFRDFCAAKEGPLLWKALAAKMATKYKGIVEAKEAVSDELRAQWAINRQFFNRLNADNDRKAVLVYGATWGFTSTVLAQDLLSHSNLSFYALSLSPSLFLTLRMYMR